MYELILLYAAICLSIFLVFIRLVSPNSFTELVLGFVMSTIPVLNLITTIMLAIDAGVPEKVFNVLMKDIF
jgi:hypothetical protein